MKISITPISMSSQFRTGEMNIHRFIDYCAELEVDGIDVLESNCYSWFWENKAKEFAELPNMLESAGLKLAACATGNNFAKADDEQWRSNVDVVINAIRETSELGAPVLRVFGGCHKDTGGDPNMDFASGLGRVVEGLAECLPEAEKQGVILALENHGGLPGHSYEVKRILDHFNSPWLKVTFDCANFMANNMDEPENPLTAYGRLKDHVVHVHVKDMGPAISDNHRRIEGYVAGVGLVPLRQFVAQLEENGYTGYCSLEYEASRITPETDGVPRSVEYLKRIRAIHRMFDEKDGK